MSLLYVFGFVAFWIVAVVEVFVVSSVGVEVFIVWVVVGVIVFDVITGGDKNSISFSVLSDCCEVGVSSIMVISGWGS